MAGRVEQGGDLGRLREHFSMQGGQLVSHSPASDQGQQRSGPRPGAPRTVCSETLPGPASCRGSRVSRAAARECSLFWGFCSKAQTHSEELGENNSGHVCIRVLFLGRMFRLQGKPLYLKTDFPYPNYYYRKLLGNVEVRKVASTRKIYIPPTFFNSY